jgi:hypothetical protein
MPAPTGAGAPLSTILMEQAPMLSAPVLAVVKPLLQGRQWLLPSEVEYVPSGQSRHAFERAAGAYCPAGHRMHSVEPGM